MLRKWTLLFTFALSCVSGRVEAQDLNDTYRFGLEQFALKHYESASLAFERVLYFGNGQFAVSTLDHLAQIKLLTEDIEGAMNYYNRAAVASEDYAERSWYTLRKCACLLSLHRTKYALIDLYDFTDNLPDSTLRYRNFLLGIAHFTELNFADSRIAFKQAIPESDVAKRNELDSLFAVVEDIKHPDPKKARIMSMILPGLGQFYAGDIKNGINSLLLTGGFVYLGINTIINYGYLSALASVLPWYQRYFQGGFNRAERIAAARLEEKRDAIYQQVLQLYE